MEPVIVNSDTPIRLSLYGLMMDWYVDAVRARPEMWNRLEVFTEEHEGRTPDEPYVYWQQEVDPVNGEPIGEPLFIVHVITKPQERGL